jgi:protein-S-isoprenylcysteine O-methyltransferase Ste14
MTLRRRVLPPVWFAGCLLLAVALHWLLPIFPFDVLPGRLFGAALILSGIFLSATAAGAFKRAGTPVIPFETSTVLLTDGWYRYTRNPMYLGMTLALMGFGLALGSVGGLLPVAAFVAVIHTQFIRGEERLLTEIFGQQYLDYCTRVRRWL